jgi:hypothetical protein
MASKLQACIPADLKICEEELHEVLNSKLFCRAPSLSKLLQFVCRKTLDGEAGLINEWTIAVDGLQRRKDFDPEKDSIVRVEFHHLRKRLAQYYETEGSDHAIRIVLSESGYVPRFLPCPEHQAVPEPVADEPAAQPSMSAPGIIPEAAPVARRRPVFAFAGVGLALLMVLGLTWKLSSDDPVNAGVAPAPIPSSGEGTRILAGFTGSRFVDSNGKTWMGDQYGQGGAVFSHPEVRIRRTLDETLYQSGREGESHYDIPVKPGIYELRLHFAETRYGLSPLTGAEAQRRFSVYLNNKEILHDFDIVSDAGGAGTATVKVWTDVSPGADGTVHLFFTGHRGPPLVNAIELVPGMREKMLPVRFTAATHPVYDRAGQVWHADEYFLGGRMGERAARIEGEDDPALYSGCRYGNFSYAVPVVAGRTYQAAITFMENTYSNFGDRVFDLYLNNSRSLLADFDVLKESGGTMYRPIKRTFKGLKPNAQDKLLFSFVPRKDYAQVFSIEVVQQSSR